MKLDFNEAKQTAHFIRFRELIPIGAKGSAHLLEFLLLIPMGAKELAPSIGIE